MVLKPVVFSLREPFPPANYYNNLQSVHTLYLLQL